MLDANHMHVVGREPSRPDDRGRPMNRHVRTCEACRGSGFREDGHDPVNGCGWCQECQGLGWYAVVTVGDVLRTIFAGGAVIGLIILALAVTP